MSASQALAVIRLIIVSGVLLVMYLQWRYGTDTSLGRPVVYWMVHSVIYLVSYMVISFSYPVPAQFFNVWSAALQIHGYLTIFVMELFRYLRVHNSRKGD